MNEILIFLASTKKGDGLFRELSKRFDESHFIPMGYRSLPPAISHSLRLLERLGLRLKDHPELDYRMRLLIAKRARRSVNEIVKGARGRPVYALFWQCLFPVTRDWQEVGHLSYISDVAMTEVYFDNFRIRTAKARTLRKNLVRITVENCEDFFTHSCWAAEENKRLYPAHAGKILRMGWGPDVPPLPREVALAARNGRRVLCVGHDYLRKGVDFYNQVAGGLKQKIPGVECLVAGLPGRGFPVESLRHLTVLGPVSHQQLAEQLKEASLFVLFSKFEPAGHVTIEAMSHGVPVVCSNPGGIAEPVVDGVTGFVCPSFSVPEAVERCYRILADPTALAAFRQRAYEHAVGSWQWSHVADRIMSRLKPHETRVLASG